MRIELKLLLDHHVNHLFPFLAFVTAALMAQFLPNIAQFLGVISEDPHRDDVVTEKAVDLIG